MIRKSKRFICFFFAACLYAASPVSTYAATITKRLWGNDRYETAVAVSKEGWQFSNYAVVVSGDNFPDALSAAPLARKYNCPILLTNGEALNIYTSYELKRLNVKNVYIIGGTGVVSDAVDEKIKSMGMTTKRLAGIDRYGTSIAVAKEMGNFSEAVIANGYDYYDAISIAPIAAKRGMPIILTSGEYLPGDVGQFLSGQSISKAYVMGGEDIVGGAVTKNIPNVKRIYGENKYARNLAVLSEFPGDVDFSTTLVASGNDYPDGLAGAALAPKSSSPIILLDKEMPTELKAFFTSKLINKIDVLGGPAAVSYDLEKAIKALPLVVSSTYNITDTIVQNQSYTPPKTVIVSVSNNSQVEVPVKWNLTKVDTTKPGILTYKGTIDGYSEPVTLTLIVKPIILKIQDLEAETEFKDTFIIPQSISAQMSDGSVSNVPVNWSYPTTTSSKPGVYTFQGKVEGYNKTVKLILTVKPSLEQDIGDIIGAEDITDEVIHGESYKLPTEVTVKMKDGSTKKYPVKWDDVKIDTSIVGTTVLNGTLKDYNVRVKLTLTIKPKILYVQNIVKNVTRGYNLTIPDKVRTVMSDNTRPELPVTWNLKTIDTNAIGTYTLQGKVDGYDSPVSLTVNVIKDYLVTFNDVRLQSVIRTAINKPMGSIYKSNIETIKSLNASNLGISDLSGLGNLTDLESLNLDGNSIINVDEVSSLTELRTLSLSNNKIININSLNKLINLTTLNLSDNKVKYVNALEDLNQIENLYLKNNPIADYSPIIYYYDNLKDKDFSF